MANHEKHIDDLLRDALGEYTEQPPIGAWTDMEAKLDDDKTVIDLFFVEALSDYTETPPANAWAGMEAKLGGKTEFDHAFAEALGDYSEAPPANAWADMAARLDKKPQRRRGIIWFWSAAALSGLLAIGYFFLGNNENHSANRQAEVQTETPVALPGTNTPAPSTVEVKKEMPAPIPQQAPKENHTVPGHTPLVEKNTPKQDAPVVAEKQEVPAQNNIQKTEPQAQQMPAENKDVAAQNDSVNAKVIVDDIAAAIRRRANNTVMIVKKSRYADSMAQVELIAKQKEEEAAKQQPIPVAEPTPVIAAKVDTIKEVAKEEAIATPDTISALALDAINQTEKNMVVKQDAIPAAQITEPVEKAVFEMGGLAAKVAETSTNDPEKGSLAAFIGPVEDTEVYNNTAVAENAPLDDPKKVRTPIKLDWYVKAGYETGLNKMTANKFVFAPTVQVGITNKLSLMLQPTIKSGKTNYSEVSGKKSYHEIVSNDRDSLKTFYNNVSAQGIISVYMKNTQYYMQKHDSLVVSNNLSTRSIVEAELPVMLNYKVGKNLSVFGGPVVTYSTMLQIDEKIERYEGATRIDSVVHPVVNLSQPKGTKPPVNPTMDEVFTYNTPDINQYDATPYANSTINKIRFGYMLGASYNYKRLSADVTVQQNLSRMNYIPNAGVRNIYLQPYMRFMLGFKLNGNKK